MKEVGKNQTQKASLLVELSTVEDVCVIHVSGSFVGKAVSVFRRVCSDAQRLGLPHRVVDLSEVDEIDGYGIACLVGLLARRKKARGHVILCGINPDLRHKFEATRCDSVFRMAVSSSGALELLKGSSR